MIFDSVAVMTTIDLIVLAVVGWGLWVVLGPARPFADWKVRTGRKATTLGLLFVGAFYLTDLVAMYLLPIFMPKADAMVFMTELHLNYSWILAAGGIGLVIMGFTRIDIRLREMVGRLARSRQEHEKSEAVLNEAQRIAKIGSWEWNIETNETWWSDEVHRMFGTERQSFGANDRAFLERVHPDDRNLIGDSIRRALDKGEEYSIDHRIIMMDGTEKMVHERAEFAFDADGRPIRMTGTVEDITERKEAAEKLRRREEFLQTLLDTSPVAISVSSKDDGRFLMVNRASADYHRLSAADLLRRNTIDVYFDPEDRREILQQFGETGQLHDVDIHGRRLGTGEECWFSLSATPIEYDGQVAILSAVQDITERKRIEGALADQRDRLRRLLESTNAVPWEARIESGSFSYVGPQAVELLGYPQEKWLEEDFWTVHMHPDDRDWVPGYCGDMAGKGHDFEFEYRMMAKDDRVVWLHEIVHVIREGGRPTGLQGFLIDITERKRVEKALHDSERRARRLQSDLHHVARVSAMGEMASTLAHELNQPLAALTNYVQAARKTMEGSDAADRKKVAEYMENAVAQSTRASEILRGLRKFVTKGEAERSLNDINALIEEAVLLTAPEGKINGIELKTEFAPDLMPILVEKIRVQQVVINLVRNGIEALSDTDGGRLRVTTALTADDFIEVSVTDNGPGLAEGMSGKLFQSFVTTKPRGMGVGLSICRSIIENHGGRIWAESNSDGGMSFHFTLPILPQDDSANE